MKKICLGALAVAGFLSVLSGPSWAQDAKPEKKDTKPAEPAAKKATGAKYLCYVARGEGRGNVLKQINLETRESKTILGEKTEGRYMVMEVSPNRKIASVYVRTEKMRGVKLFDLEKGEWLKKQPVPDRTFVKFLSNDRFAYLEDCKRPKDMKEGEKPVRVRIGVSNIDGSEKKVLYESKGGYWDDAFFTLTPDKQHGIYFARDEKGSKRGLVMVSLKDGKTTDMPAGLTFARFSPDGKWLYGLHKEGEVLKRYSYDGKGTFKEEKDFGKFMMVTRFLDKGHMVAMSIDKKQGRSMRLIVIDKDGTEKMELSKSYRINEIDLLMGMPYDAKTQTCYFIEQEVKEDGSRGNTKLIGAVIKDGQVAGRKVFAESEKRLAMPFLR